MKNTFRFLTRLLLVAVACLVCVPLPAQTSEVGGIVTDANGMTLVGATVVVENQNGTTGGGTTTGADGRFALRAEPGQSLLVSYIGYTGQKVQVVAGKTEYAVALEEDQASIDEVVVVGYGVQKKVNLTGAVASVDAKDINSRPVVSISSALQGMAPGVTVTSQSGAPGDDAGKIRIRGINSFGGSSTSPLVLIDGIEGSMDSVDPSLIESISILKDAASASIYGSRAANGVILVSTKRGSKDKFTITYKGYVGWQKPTSLPDKVDAYEHRLLTNVTLQNDGEKPLYDEEEMALYLKNMGKDADLYPNTDWQDAVLQGSGFTHGHNVTMTLGSQRVRMLTSLGYVDQLGIIKNTGFERYTFRNNADVEFNKKLSMSLDLSFSNGDRYYSPYQSTIFNYMNTRSADIPNQFTTGLYNGLGLQNNNPVALMLEGGQYKTNTLRLNGAITLRYKPWEWMTLEGKLAPRYTTTNKHNFRSPVTTYDDASGSNPKASAPYHSLTESGSRAFYGNYNFLMTLGHDFKSHSVKLILGAERNTYDYKYLSAYREVFNYPEYDQIDAGELDNLANGGHRYQWAIQSYFGRINYNYKERYLLEANLRIDGSSRFSPANRWGYFPSVSGAWRISEEPFMENIKHVVSALKLRASYGTLGNQNLAGSDAANYYPTTPNLALGWISMNDHINSIVTLNTMANPDIKWETTTMVDVGLDLTLFGKLNITGDWYRKMTRDILMKLDLSLLVGLNAPYQNAGKVRNTGWEIGINYANKWRDFSFSVGANLSDVRNEIVDMQGRTSTNGVMRNQEGYSIGSIYALESMGIIQTQEEADWVNANCKQYNTVKPGDIRYADRNHDNKITDEDKTIIGSTVPRYTYSMNLSFGWKGLTLSALFQGVGKVDGYLNYYYVMPGYQGGTFRKEHLDYWSETNPDGKTPRLSSADSNNWKDSSFWMKSASYLRLKNLQIGYELPKKWTRKIGLGSAFIYVNAQNLFTATNFWQGYDPEVAYGGDTSKEFDAVALGGASAANNYPQVKIYTVGLDLKF
ncbi:SusC/RagA family TonB-linked outer membrane protein [Alistipes sp.]|uniref:SusC/RagA family TonB-linked outer membrane protein n=1 Tax=Alistipes sp. TaxID=1872444 RepID=UPI003AF00FEF